jgi:N utilization substance protein A
VNLTDVIEGLVEERGLGREEVISIVCEGMRAAYAKKFPNLEIATVYNKKTGQVEVFAQKTVVSSVENDDAEISLRRARTIDPDAKRGSVVPVPIKEKVGRIEILTAKQVIAGMIRELEQSAVYDEFKDKEGIIISGTVHKRERAGFIVKVGDVIALLPRSGVIPGETVRIGAPIRALLKEVLPVARGDCQLILDRASADFVKKLIAIEIPEVFEGIVEIKKVARIAGYKTKVIVTSNSKEIDPVGTCVGVGGVRIKPILKELGREKVDLIEWTDDSEELVKYSLKPAEIDKVEISEDGKKAVVWLAQDQRSYAIGKMGQNIALASRLTGIEVQLQDALFPSQELLEFSAEQEEEAEPGGKPEEEAESGGKPEEEAESGGKEEQDKE